MQLDDFGKAIFMHMLACEEFRSKRGRFPRPEEMSKPVFGRPYVGPEPAFEAESKWDNPDPGVSFNQRSKGGRVEHEWIASLGLPDGRTAKTSARTRYEACQKFNAMVKKHYGPKDKRLIDLSLIPKGKAV